MLQSVMRNVAFNYFGKIRGKNIEKQNIISSLSCKHFFLIFITINLEQQSSHVRPSACPDGTTRLPLTDFHEI